MNQLFISTDNLFMTIQNNYLLKKESLSLNMLILKEYKESLQLWEPKFYLHLIIQKEKIKFWEHVTQLKKS